MPRSAVSAGTDRLLHGSPQRTVYVSPDPATGELRACKVFVAGSMADAEHEFAMGRACAGPGVVRHVECCTDPATNRPCTMTVFEAGADLDRIVADQGALPAAFACRLLAPVASTLAAMHALQLPEAPTGICHGDVKPKNLLQTATTTLLLDFEHAQAIVAPMPGKPRGDAHDVHGLGSTLAWLVTGGGCCTLPQHPDFVALVAACTAADPAARPSAATVAAKLRTLAIQLASDPDEAVLDATARGERVVPATAIQRPGLADHVRRRARLLARLPSLLEIPAAQPTEPAALRREIRTANRALRLFPRHQPAWRWRRDLCAATGRLLSGAAEQVGAMRRAEEFADAAHWLGEARELTLTVLQLPGGCTIPRTGAPTAVGLLHRDPAAFLEMLAEQTDAARQELAAEVQTIVDAESHLDLERAEQAIEAMSSRYGGSSPSVTRRRDQLHRLGFYLDRIARAQSNVERVVTLWDGAALKPLLDLVAGAVGASQRRTRGDGAGGVVGLRSLQITLVNLGEEFPHVPASAALETLSQALAHLTDQGWSLMADAERCLRAVPVPVRPLQIALSRLDTYRILEAFVDRPGRPRSQLQDALESLRLRLDQARATRDRLTEGAEQAMARGHWTTGLFDMERAVADLEPVDEGERAEAARLAAKLEEARRRKQEVEVAVRRNVELGTRYGTLQDDPSSSFAERLQVLNERRDCLHMLAVHAPAERTVLYTNDLREVETQIGLEQAASAEHRLDGTVDPFERLRIARETVDHLTASLGADPAHEAPGRLVRLLDHWRTLADHCKRAADQARDEARTGQVHSRRVWRVATAAALASATLIILAVWPWLTGSPANATTRDPLVTRANELPEPLRFAGERLLATARLPAIVGDAFDATVWSEAWKTHLRAFAKLANTAAEPTAARTFANACWDEALVAVRSRLDDDERAALDRDMAALATELRATGVQPTSR